MYDRWYILTLFCYTILVLLLLFYFLSRSDKGYQMMWFLIKLPSVLNYYLYCFTTLVGILVVCMSLLFSFNWSVCFRKDGKKTLHSFIHAKKRDETNKNKNPFDCNFSILWKISWSVEFNFWDTVEQNIIVLFSEKKYVRLIRFKLNREWMNPLYVRLNRIKWIKIEWIIQ